MKIKGLVWLGTRTSKFEQMLDFYQNVMGLDTFLKEPGFAILDMPNGDRLEIFGSDSPHNPFMTHPVVGFLVDDIVAARAEMEAAGVNFMGPIRTGEAGYAWSHFLAPDGFVYELTCNPAHPSHLRDEE
jgi:catechol 2,3-dioxygenase-like lactoylglutathione lyase family enzyme